MKQKIVIFQDICYYPINARDSLNEKYHKYDENKKIMVSALPETDGNQKGVVFSIEDFGMGIDETISEKIFESFFTTKPVESGTGLGLFISRQIIEEHNGRIWFESNPGSGTTFFFFIPFGT